MKELLKKKSVKIALLLIVLLVVMGIVGMNARSAQHRKEYNAHIDAAEKYLTELDYEQAIAEYTLALEIEPNAEEVLNGLEQTYLDYAQSLADAGEYEKAVSVLEEGYAQTGRESLREKMEDVRKQQAQREAEERARIEEEEKKKEEIIDLVESREFHDRLDSMESMLQYTYFVASGGNTYVRRLTNAQIEELCRQYLDILEPYKEYYGEDWYNHNCFNDPYDWRLLSQLYLAVGEYELCIEIRNQLYEVTQDDDIFGRKNVKEYENSKTEKEYDEYGRLIYVKDTDFYPDDSTEREEIIEYGEYNKPIRHTEEYRSSKSRVESVTVFEYDSEGRPSETKCSIHTWDFTEGIEQFNELTFTYIYNGSGFTEKYRGEGWNSSETGSSIVGLSQDYVIDEYGEIELVGEPYDIYRN